MNIDQALQLAVKHHQAGRLAQAEEIYRQILAQAPDHADTLHLLGVLSGQMGRKEMGVELIGRAIQLKPDYAGAHSNLGLILSEMGRFDEAIAAHRRAIQLQPDFADAHNNLGAVLKETGRLDEAVASYRRAIQLKPDYAAAHNNLGVALSDLGRLDEAIAVFSRAIQLNPRNPKTHSNLGSAWAKKGRFSDAIDAHNRAIQLKPDFAEAHSNLGNALKDNGRLDEAIAAYRRAIQFKPDFPEAHSNLGNALKDMGRMDEALASYRRAVALWPESSALHSNVLLGLHYCETDPAPIVAEHRIWADRHAASLAAKIRPHENDRDPDRRLRIAYFSPDFREHAVALLLEGLLSNHHHDQFEIFCYSEVIRPDAVTQRCKGYADHWRDLPGLSDAAAAEMIRADRIDILIDLAGHSSRNRMLLFAHKPAPVQVVHIYPASTGLPTIDYRITDPYFDPPGCEPSGPEELVRLPHTFFCYRPGSEEPAVAPLPAPSRGQVTFGSLNNLCKVSPAAIELWSRTLKATPRSRLLILSGGDPGTRTYLLDQFSRHGIAADRLEFPARSPRQEYLAIYNQIDIGLDPLPYTGHTTGFDSFWMGVPVVTLPGRTSVSHGGVSLASNLNLPELIAATPDEYVKIAATLAGDLPRLSSLRGQLRQRMKDSPLMDEAGYTRDLETAYRRMWKRWATSR